MGQMEGQLIEAVYKRKSIWDPTDKLRKNSRILNRLWLQVGNELGVDMKVAKAKWKNLRQYFVGEMRKINQAQKSGHEKVTSTWSHFNQLMFLRDTLNTFDDTLDTNCYEFESGTVIGDETEYDPEITLSLTGNQSEIDDINNLQPTEDPLEVETQYVYPASNNLHNRRTIAHKRKLGRAGLEERYNSTKRARQLLAIEKRKVDLLEKEIIMDNNPDLQFFKSLMPYMAEFSPIQKLRIRSKIQEIILNEHEKVSTAVCTSLENS